MNKHADGRLWKWMATAVLAHLVTSVVHGAAHGGAQIPMSMVANLFVFVVILAGPVLGLALSWRAERLGSLIVALTMAGSLVFGFVNHFVLDSPDHVSQVEAQWRMIFGTTAMLLTITEMLGLGFAVRLIRVRRLS
jgi:hypothetical protein